MKMLGSLQHDLIGRRNTHLIGEMNAALVEFDLVVAPWGALHLPGIERALLESGFSEVARRDRRLLSWTTLLAP